MSDTTTPAGTDFLTWNHHRLAALARELTEEVLRLREENARLRALKAEADAALSGEIPAGLRFTMETEAAKIVERLQGPKEAGQ